MIHRGIDEFARRTMMEQTHEAMATTLAGEFPKPFFVITDRDRKRLRLDVQAVDAAGGSTLAGAAAMVLVPALRRKKAVTAGIVLCAKYSPDGAADSASLPSFATAETTYALIFLADRISTECLRAIVTERDGAHPFCGEFESIETPELEGPVTTLRAAFKLAGLS